MNKYRLPPSIYDRRNDYEPSDEDIKRNFDGKSDIAINTTAREIIGIEDKTDERY